VVDDACDLEEILPDVLSTANPIGPEVRRERTHMAGFFLLSDLRGLGGNR